MRGQGQVSVFESGEINRIDGVLIVYSTIHAQNFGNNLGLSSHQSEVILDLR